MNGTALCNCCAGIHQATPATIDNRPGLSEIAYRIGTWATFKESMLDALSTVESLAALKTRDDDDFTIALCDAFAVVCDILTFYYERSANEHYLRTATQLLSVAELAALIGYEPAPGVAASAALAFTLDAPPPAMPTVPRPPQPVLVPNVIALAAGVQVQSVPGPGETPVTFETSAPIAARYAWNAIAPRASMPYAATQGNTSPSHLRLKTILGTLQTGDHVLIVVDNGTYTGLNRVTAVQTDTATQTTLVSFESIGGSSQTPDLQTDPSAVGSDLSGSPTAANVAAQVTGVTWSDQTDFVAQAQKLQWDLDATEDLIDAVVAAGPATAPLRIFKLGVRASAFGHNAPSYATLPATMTSQSNFPGSWDNNTLGETNPDGSGTTANVQLDTTYPALVGGTWVVINDDSWVAAQVTAARTLSVANYLLASTVTQITLGLDAFALYFFGMRTASVLGATDEFTLAQEFADGTTIGGSRITLASAQLGLAVGQDVIVTGTSATKTGSTGIELRTIQALALVGGLTQITFDRALDDTYVWNTVALNANVVDATQGTSCSQILGSGNAAAAYQRFALNQLPVTYVSAATPSTTASTLQVRVNGELWTEVPYLYGHAPTERVFVTSVDQNGTRFVEFGDGAENGARLPTGTNNVVAYYRQGLGAAGNVRASQLSTLLTRPLGLRSVINPLAASGGGDPQTLGDARATAPITVRALGRIVSLDDFADFANAAPSVAKAAAVWAWNGVRNVVCITVAGPAGAAIVPETDAYTNLLAAIVDAGDGTVPVALVPYVPRTFTIGATLTIDPALDSGTVLASARAAVQSAFCFSARAFMQPVYSSEVVALLQGVPGVVALTLDSFRFNDNSASNPPPGTDPLTAAPPGIVAGVLTGAELLTIDTGPLPGLVSA